ncbi:MAG TPA: hypothetical protein VIK01_22705, partial [Polyangiaceae bacterium]
ASARALLNWLVAASPCGRILFTSDWQFGPDWTKRFAAITLNEFWRLHDSRALLLNAAYPVAAAVYSACSGRAPRFARRSPLKP